MRSGSTTAYASAVSASETSAAACGTSSRSAMSWSYRPDEEHASNSSAKTRLTCRYSTPSLSKTNPLGSRNDAPRRVNLSVVPVEQRDEECLGGATRTTHECKRRDCSRNHYLEDETACGGIDVHGWLPVSCADLSFARVTSISRLCNDRNHQVFNGVPPTAHIVPPRRRTGWRPASRKPCPSASVHSPGRERGQMAAGGTSAGFENASLSGLDRPRAKDGAGSGCRVREPVSAWA